MTMSARKRMRTALACEIPDRLPVTTHHVLPSYLASALGGATDQDFFDRFGLDPIIWPNPVRAEASRGEYLDPEQGSLGFLEARRVVTEHWRIREEALPGHEVSTVRYTFETPGGTLSMVLQSNEHTSWVVEHLLKHKRDVDLLGQYMPAPSCDVAEVNRVSEAFGERGLVRGFGCCFDVFGQPGCWQDAACLVDIQELILACFDDPSWVHALLGVLQRRKLAYAVTLDGATYDVIELGGGAASSTVISPALFEEFVAPYDRVLIDAFHAAGQKVVYHTCGGMMPLLEGLVAMGPDAMETFTPCGMGADVDLAAAKRRVGDKICMIGGFDQFHFFVGCTPGETRAEVRRCFEAAGGGGGFILSPSDHFFEADHALLAAYADEARRCSYGGTEA